MATPYSPINILLQRLLREVQSVLGEAFVGLIVHGSLAAGDFNPQRSDIDFLVVTREALAGELLLSVIAMHQRLTSSGLEWATKMEGSYIPQAALRRYDPTNAIHPALRCDGSFGLDYHGSDWIIQRHLIREKGLVLAGPAPQTLIDAVRPEALRRAVIGILREWWEPQLSDSHRLHSTEYQAYAVLTMCRCLYTLHHAAVVSKPVAAIWAQGQVGARWAGLIELAVGWQHGIAWDQLGEVLEFIRMTLGEVQRFGA